MNSKSRIIVIAPNDYAECKKFQTGEKPNSNMAKISLRINPVTKVPAEVWEMISDNVDSGTDLASLSKAVPLCGKLLYPKRVEWLFEQVLPLVLTHNNDLAIDDILTCRRVCKKWTYAVDILVENTITSDCISGEKVNLNMNQRLWRQANLPYKLSLQKIGIMRQPKMLVMLNEAKAHPRNPIIGKCVKMEVPTTNRRGSLDLIRDFLGVFGHHISFLHVTFNGKTDPTTFLHIFVPFLQQLPNLKKLAIEKFKRNSSATPLAPARMKAVKRQLDKFNESTVLSESFRKDVPKIECLNLLINGLCEETFKNVLINIFSGEYLKSLTISELDIAENSNFLLPNLVYLNLQLKTNEQLQSLQFLPCSKIEKLFLNLENCENINCKFMFQVLRKFQNTLNHLEITLPNFLETFTVIANGLSLIGGSKLMLFSDSEYLQMPKLKVLTLLGFRPPSFNFIAGFRSLEHLNFYFDREIVWEHFLKGLYHPDVQNSEILDVIRKMRQTWSSFECGNKPEMRTSNVWNNFPSMKTLNINKGLRWESLGSIGEWQYRRNN